jgi:hypothetical protein
MALGCCRSLAGIAGSNPTGAMDLSPLSVVCRQVEISTTGWSLFQKCMSVISKPKQWGGHGQVELKKKKKKQHIPTSYFNFVKSVITTCLIYEVLNVGASVWLLNAIRRQMETMVRVPKMVRGRFPWQEAFTAVTNYWFILPDQNLYIVNSTYVYISISDCIQTVYELPLLPKNTAT